MEDQLKTYTLSELQAEKSRLEFTLQRKRHQPAQITERLEAVLQEIARRAE